MWVTIKWLFDGWSIRMNKGSLSNQNELPATSWERFTSNRVKYENTLRYFRSGLSQWSRLWILVWFLREKKGYEWLLRNKHSFSSLIPTILPLKCVSHTAHDNAPTAVCSACDAVGDVWLFILKSIFLKKKRINITNHPHRKQKTHLKHQNRFNLMCRGCERERKDLQVAALKGRMCVIREEGGTLTKKMRARLSGVRFLLEAALCSCRASRTVVGYSEQRNPQRQACWVWELKIASSVGQAPLRYYAFQHSALCRGTLRDWDRGSL